MKTFLTVICTFAVMSLSAQDHFSGINTSKRVGILNVSNNPAEVTDLTSRFETNLFSTSFNISNNIINLKDINANNNIEDLIFKSDKPVNLRIDAELYGPAFAMRIKKWGFGISTKAYAKMNLVDIDPNLGDAINTTSSGDNTSVTVSNDKNQRLNGTTWGEVGFSIGRQVYETEKHKVSVGATFKLLFPGSYANLAADKFSGTINNNFGDATLTNTTANLNIAYSGNLANSFTNFNDYSKSIFGGLSGMAADIGVSYKLKDKDKGYKIRTGAAVRNMGGMTFKADNNSYTSYKLSVQGSNALDLNQFKDINSLADIEDTLLNSGYLDKTVKTNADFKVKLPTVFSAYADFKLISKFYVTLYAQQKLGNDNNDNQITTQNIISITPRLAFNNFEVYSSWADNEISGTSGGFGLRFCGFYLGSSSVITALANNTKQGDFYLGYQFGIGK